MGSLVRATQNLQLQEKEKKWLEKVNEIQRSITKILKTLVVDADERYKYIIAVNKFANREFSQTESFDIPSGLLGHFQDLSPFIDNGFVFETRLNQTVSPIAVICLEENMAFDEVIFTTLQPFDQLNLSVEDETLDVLVYINIRDGLSYTSTEEYVKQTYPDFKIISTSKLSQDFDPNKHTLINMADLATGVAEFIMNGRETFSSLIQNNENKEIFINDTKGAPSFLSITDVLAFSEVYDLPVTTSSRYALPYGRFLAELWFMFDEKIKTFYEFVEDVFSAPSCVLVSGLIPFFGCIVKVKLDINSTNVETQQEILIQSDKKSGFSEVSGNLTHYLKMDTQNVRTRLFRYDNMICRVNSVSVKLTLRGYVPGNRTPITKEINYSGRVSLLNNLWNTQVYSQLLAMDGIRRTTVPSRFLIYLVRQQQLGFEMAANLGVSSKDVNFWRKENQSLPVALEKIQEIVSIETLEKLNQFSGEDGFLNSKILLRLDMLGAESV